MMTNEIFTGLALRLPLTTGFGAVFHEILTLYAICRRLGVYYVHTPLKAVEHHEYNPGGVEQADKEWNEYLVQNLIPTKLFTYPPINESEYIDHDSAIEHIRKTISQSFTKTRVFRIDYENIPQNKDKDISLITDIKNDLINHYKNSKYLKETYFKDSEISIAIHMRRFSRTDCPECNTPNREYFLKNNHMDRYYQRVINNFSKLLVNRKACFYIYSQSGNQSIDSEFGHFKRLVCDKNHRVELHIDEHPVTTMHHLIKANIFVASKSAFSYCSHIYSSGLVFARPGFVHTYLPKVQIINDAVQIDKKAIDDYLSTVF